MATTTNFGWETPDDTDLVKDGAAAIRTLGQSIDTSMADLEGGTTGQILAKNSNTDMDFVWTTPNPGDITGVTAGVGISGGGTSGSVTVTNSMATEITTAGDLIRGTGSGTFSRLGIGSTGQVLTVAAGQPSWATPAGNKSFTQLSTTALTGASTITVSGLSGYDNFVILIQNAAGVANSNTATLRINGDTATNYLHAGILFYGIATYSANIFNDGQASNDTSFPLATMTSGAGQTNFSSGISILGGNSTGFKGVTVMSTADIGQAPSSDDQRGRTYQGIYKATAVISSVSLISSSGNFSQGNMLIFGAN